MERTSTDRFGERIRNGLPLVGQPGGVEGLDDGDSVLRELHGQAVTAICESYLHQARSALPGKRNFGLGLFSDAIKVILSAQNNFVAHQRGGGIGFIRQLIGGDYFKLRSALQDQARAITSEDIDFV